MNYSTLLVNFAFYNKPITVNFNGGDISSDGGLLLIKEFDKKIGYIDSISKCIEEYRIPNLIKHQIGQLISQRIYQIIAGYEDAVDCNAGYEDAVDCNLLRDDGIIKLVTGKKLNEKASSQPTMSRLENSVTAEDNERLNGQLTENFIKANKKRIKRKKEVTLEIDSTDDPAYGEQQMVLFNGYYGEYMYHPLIIHDRESVMVVRIKLRAGNVHTSDGVVEEIDKVVKKLRERFKDIRIKLVADSGFSIPELYRYCERKDINIEYLIVIKTNSVINSKIEAKIKGNKIVEKIKREDGNRYYSSIKYKAESWEKQRRVIIKISHSEEEENGIRVRKIVTNMKGRAKELYEEYEKRGEQENRIKELKNGFKADRLSCKKFSANEFRLLIHTHAYNLIVLFRRQIKGSEIGNCQIESLRTKLIKVGVMIKESVRRIWVYISSSWPYQRIYKEVKESLTKVKIPLLSES